MRVNTRLAERLEKVSASVTLAITSGAKKLKAEGVDVISLAAGEPDFDTPDYIKQAAIEAINNGFTKYTPTTGIPELKKAISEKFRRDNSLKYEPNQIVVSCGAKHSIYNALQVLVDKDDEVLMPSPYWVSYPEMVNLCQGVSRFIKTNIESGFKIEVSDLQRHISSKTKVLIINSPSNPTGSVYSGDELRSIAEVCAKRKIFVISDEIYEKLIYQGQKATSIASLKDDIYNLTITVSGLSKSYAMTGWRIGYLGAPQDVSDAISKLQSHSTSCPSSISQKAATAALGGGGDFIEKMVVEFEKRRDFAAGKLDRIPKISYTKPAGAFYIFCNISKSGLDSVNFATRLLEEASVAVVPGVAFGDDNYIRISFATSIEELGKGLDRMASWLK
ncbi:MAG: pyridoxal phosphate-dependent aminotransferase [Candidatus Omnitrophica bacterium]|nr:pyridoxal phosphate-dependent aminotransferase [Candidatus Omnitrophota bacterium]